jgi:UDP-3-O-[3-hydroxymyristoyl] glucosamine N-acyltransferase
MRRKKNITLNLAELAAQLRAEVTGAPGARDVTLSGICTLEEAGPAELAFVAGDKYLARAAASKAGALLVTQQTVVPGRPCLVVEHVWKAGLKALDIWYPDEHAPAGAHPSAVVSAAARLGAGVSVGPLAVIEDGAEIGEGAEIGAQCFVGRDARIGAGSLLHPGVRVLERVRVGRGVILHSGVVLGADGFGYEVIAGRGVKIPQVGTVVIEDDVEIGANTCVDRAFLTETRIGAGTKIDNLVQIAHNCRIGRSCGFAAQVGIAGSTKVGDGCIFWGQAGIRDNLTIGNRVVLMGQSAPKGDVGDGAVLVGSPARPLTEMARIYAAENRLPEMLKRLKALEKKAG